MVSRVLEHTQLARDVMRLRLSGDTRDCAPGRFAHLQMPGFFLRRPISLCDWDAQSYSLVYKVVGAGTRAMAQLVPGDLVDALVGLGSGYRLDEMGMRPLLVGGGSGVPPLYALAKALIARGAKPVAALGFAGPEEVFMADDFSALMETKLAVGGYVTDAIGGVDCDYVAACGPEPMLRAVYDALKLPGQFSFEARMACGIGACMGCTCETKLGPKRICADGPVFRREEIAWTRG
jgi:dihydroorotate dehydrogenase electron transfer subunit